MTFFMYVFTQANAAEMGRTVICVGSGNEGSSGGHLSGSLLEEPEAGPFPGGQRAAGSGEAVPSRMGNAVARSVSVELAVAEYERSLKITVTSTASICVLPEDRRRSCRR